MARKRGRKKNSNRRIILIISLAVVSFIGIGFFTAEPASRSVVQLFQQDSEHVIFSPVPQDLLGDFDESLSTRCKFRSILYYVTDTGERIQGGISFQSVFSPPIEAGSIVSPFTGRTIDSFEIDVFLACKQLQDFNNKVQVTGGQFRNTIGATDSDGTEVFISEVFNPLSGVSSANPINIPNSDDSPGTKIGTLKNMRAIDIEKKLDDTTLSYSSTIRFIQGYDVTLLIDGTKESFNGSLENRYKVDIVNNKGSATPIEPSNTDLAFTILDPPSKVLVSGNVWSFKIEMTDWDQSEGFPTVTIQDSAKNIVFTKDIPLSGSNRDLSIFSDRFKFPQTKLGEYKISASVPAFRPVAVDYIKVVASGQDVPKLPESPQVDGSGQIIECLTGFSQSGNRCIQNGVPTFIDPTQLGQILGVAINSLVPIIVGVIIIGVVIMILSAILKGGKGRGSIGGGRTVIKLVGRGSGSGSSGGNGSNGEILPRGFGKGRGAV